MQLFHSRYSAVGFLWSNLKANLPAVLPWLILSLVFDLLQLVPYPPLARFLRSAYGELALFGLFVVFLVLFFPPLRVLWNCWPLPPGRCASTSPASAGPRGSGPRCSAGRCSRARC